MMNYILRFLYTARECSIQDVKNAYQYFLHRLYVVFNVQRIAFRAILWRAYYALLGWQVNRLRFTGNPWTFVHDLLFAP